MFSEKSINLLEVMRIDSERYYNDLCSEFGSDAEYFVDLIEFFDHSSKVGGNEEFLEFCKHLNLNTGTRLADWLFEFYNNLGRYFDGGVFRLFKYRQAEWGAPQVAIQRSDVPIKSDVHTLNETQIVYRGLSLAEHNSQEYAQSWTIDPIKAQEFATATYSDEPNGIVVKAIVPRDKILYFDASDSEKETIIELGAIKFAEQT
ncbi:hypothetical protein KVQ64_004362 [Vibrio vulnificus]|uniref:hypothetical protein n=1 Tax=Vibrio aestuarianus TaxID=28171 RepID=UPI001D7BEC72|nr:hypothetical protein [Vibrio aestuarianus]EHS1186013.1 hypothetical protein [Vibrio vulnificus]MDE1254976.1 hypothetical protein [Vibrio aestuarianus]